MGKKSNRGGRPHQSPERLVVDEATAPALASLLAGLGLDESSITESPLARTRSQVNLDLYPCERAALDDAAAAVGISKRSGTRLARAIVRSWLIHRWNHPGELEAFDFGEGHRWAQSLDDIRAEAQWPAGAVGASTTFAALVDRLERGDLLAVILAMVGRLSVEDREVLRRAFGESR